MATLMTSPEMGVLPRIRMGIYGEPGSGKTTFLADADTIPELAPALWLNCAGNPENHLHKIAFALNIESVQDLLVPLDYLVTGQKKNHQFAKQWKDSLPAKPFQSFVVDTFSEFQQGPLINDVTGQEIRALEKKLDIFKLPAPEALKHGKDIKQRTMNTARKALVVLQLHTFLAFQEFTLAQFEGEGGRVVAGAKVKQVDLWGQSRAAVPAYLNIMGRLYWVEGFEKQEVMRGGRKVMTDVKALYPQIKFIDPDSQAKNQLAAGHLPTVLNRPALWQIVEAVKAKHGVE
jgi:hypothetical protein